jgi:hypothetical protein
MSGVLIAVIAFAATVVICVLIMTLGLARTAAESDQVERGAARKWVARKRRSRRAA